MIHSSIISLACCHFY